MKNKIAPLLLVIGVFVLIATIMMIYGFSSGSSLQESTDSDESCARAHYEMPSLIPSVRFGNR